jgi:hypothetical protein
MAIGDTIQAGLMRTDSSAIERAGQANARANEAFGNALGQVAKGYFVGQEKKARANEIKEELMRSGLPEEAAANISKNPFLQKEHARKQDAENRMEIAKMQAATSRANSGAQLAQEAAFEETRLGERDEAKAKLEEAEQKQIGLSNFLMSGTEMNPEVLEDFNQAQPGLFALGGDQGARNRFLESQRDTAPKVGKLGGELDSSKFGPMAMKAGVDPVLAKNRFMELQKAEAEAVQNAPSIARVVDQLNEQTGEYEQIARDKFGNPIANYGPPKPSGNYRTPKEARDEEILVGRTKDAMEFNKEARNNSNIAISQAEQAQQALKYLPETTGGLTSFVNEMKVIGESLGIDLPEGYQKDMADIGAFRQLTGQFLFQAMSNTKGAITEREMKLFRQISPDIDNSRAANKLMLEIYVKAGDRAKKRRDLIRGLQREDVDPREIQIGIEDFDDANSLIDDIRSLPRKTNSSNPQAQTNRTGVRGSNPPPNSNARTSGGFIIK